MKIRCRATYAVLIAASLLALPGHSTSFSTDQSDLYYAPGESGWALELVQRGPVIFATLLVYDQANAPTWFVAVMNNMTPGPIFGNTSWTVSARRRYNFTPRRVSGPSPSESITSPRSSRGSLFAGIPTS